MRTAGKDREKRSAVLNRAVSSPREALPPGPPARKLKPGPGLSAAAVSADQRQRLRAATIELVGGRGYDHVTVRALAKHAGVSTRTFYRHFDNALDCLAFACESTLQDALGQMKEAGSGAGDWEDGVRAVTASILSDFGTQPGAAYVVLVEAFAGGPPVLVRTKIVTNTIEELLAELMSAAPLPVPRRLVTGMVAGLIRVARSTTLAGRAEELPDLSAAVSEWILSLAAVPRESRLVSSAAADSHPGPRREPEPFPDGRHAGKEEWVGDERQRILRATVRLATRDGLPGLTVPRIRRVAGVSRRSFDSHYASVSDCFLDSLEWLARSAAARAGAWAGSDGDTGRRLRRLLLALCAQAARNDALASLVLAGILDAGRDGLVRREHLIAIGAAEISKDLALLGPPGSLALGASVAAAWEIAGTEVAAGRAHRLPASSPLLAHLLLTPLTAFTRCGADRQQR